MYRPLGKLIVDLGGWDDNAAVKGGLTAAGKCLALGKPWVRVHPQTEMTEFLVLQHGFNEDFDEEWSIFQ